MAVCDFDCFNCPHPDCIASSTQTASRQAKQTEADRERKRQKAREYYHKNREKYRAYQQAWRAAQKREKGLIPMEKYEAMALLPKVGDQRMEIMTLPKLPYPKAEARPCTVIQVNRGHRWYRVRFDNGICEAYKVPGAEGGKA